MDACEIQHQLVGNISQQFYGLSVSARNPTVPLVTLVDFRPALCEVQTALGVAVAGAPGPRMRIP